MSDKNITISVDYDDNGATAKLKELDRTIDGVGQTATQKTTPAVSQMSGVMKTVLVGAAVSAAYGAAQLVGELIQMSDEIMRVSERTGLSIKAVQQLGYVAEQSGNSIDQITSAIGQMQNRLASGDKSAVAAVSALKLNLSEIMALQPDAQFYALASAIAQIPDPMQRTQIAMDLFGRSGAAILPTMLADMQKLRDEAPVLADRTVVALDRMGDAWERLKLKAKVTVAEAVVGLATYADAFISSGIGGMIAQGVAGAYGKTGKDIVLRDETVTVTGKEPKKTTGKTVEDVMGEMSGQAQIAALGKLTAAYDGLVKQGITPTIDAQKKLHGSVEAVIKIYTDAGAKVPPKLLAIQKATQDAAKGIDRWSRETEIANDKTWEWGRTLDDELVPAIQGVQRWVNVGLLPAVEKTGGIFDETGKRIGELADTAKTALPSVSEMLGALGTAFENINSKVGQSIQVMSGFWKVMKDSAVSGVTKVVTGLSAVSEIINTVVTGTGRASVAVRGFFAGAAMGAAAGLTIASMLGMSVAAGAATMGIGAAVGALTMMVIAWNAAGKAARAANKEADAALADMRARLLDTYGSIQQVDTMGQMLGVDLAGAWGDTTTAGLKHFSQLLDEFNAKLKSLSDAAQTFGFTWADMSGEMAAFFGGKIADSLISQFDLLVNAGIGVEDVTRAMSGAINDYIADALAAGTEIPAALQPIIDKMREMGLLGTTSDIAAAAGFKTIEDLQKVADKAKAVYDYMVTSGKYSTAELAKAWEAYSKAAEATLGGVATSFSSKMQALNEEMKGLTASVAAEAEEEVMGVIETQQRERIAQIEKQKEALVIQEEAAKKAAGSVTAAAKTDFDTLFGDIVSASATAAAEVAKHWSKAPWSGGSPPPEFDTGGAADFGKGTLAMLHGREAIVPLDRPSRVGRALLGGGGAKPQAINQTIVVQLDGREVARNQQRYIPYTLKSAGY